VPADSPIKVLIVDDSLVAREMIAQILGTDAAIEVVGMARDGQEAIDSVGELKPDLITMDIHMPKVDGLQAIEQIMAYNPTPILVVSSSVHGEGVGRAFDALNVGALEVLKKPEPRDWAELEQIGSELIRKIKVLAQVRVITHIRGRRERVRPPIVHRETGEGGGRSIVAMGSSTGGPSALLSILERLPASLSVPVVVAQHIADGFVPGLVSWLDSGCALSIQVAADGREAAPGYVYIAPTGTNLVMDGMVMRCEERTTGQLYVPSADTLFDSVCDTFGRGAVGVILTGMGSDGARGLKCMREAGAVTIAQDEETSIVYGMPRAAAERGAAEIVLPIEEIAEEIERQVAGVPLR
jgi:two-component system chemotaxis response regulator CheB